MLCSPKNKLNTTHITKFLSCSRRGFTLIEILLAAFIFTAVVTSAVAIFTMTLNVQSSTRESRELVQEERLALEQISRDVRISNGAFEFCSDQNCTNIQNPPSDFLKVKSINDQNQTEERIYYVDSSVGTLGYKIVGSDAGWQPLFSERYKVTQMNNTSIFTGYSPSQLVDTTQIQQPYVTISFTVSNADSVKKESEKITQSITTSVTTTSYNQIGQWYQNPQ